MRRLTEEMSSTPLGAKKDNFAPNFSFFSHSYNKCPGIPRRDAGALGLSDAFSPQTVH